MKVKKINAVGIESVLVVSVNEGEFLISHGWEEVKEPAKKKQVKKTVKKVNKLTKELN